MTFRSRLVRINNVLQIKIHLEYLDCCLNCKYSFKTHMDLLNTNVPHPFRFLFTLKQASASQDNVLPISHPMIWFKMQIKQGLSFYIYKFSGDVDLVTTVQVEKLYGSISQTLLYTGFMTFKNSPGSSNIQQSLGTTALR